MGTNDRQLHRFCYRVKYLHSKAPFSDTWREKAVVYLEYEALLLEDDFDNFYYQNETN
jgi:hypothetical protein